MILNFIDNVQRPFLPNQLIIMAILYGSLVLNSLVAILFLAVARRIGTDFSEGHYQEKLWNVDEKDKVTSTFQLNLIRLTTLIAYMVSFYVTANFITSNMNKNKQLMTGFLSAVYLVETVVGILLLWGLIRINVIEK